MNEYELNLFYCEVSESIEIDKINKNIEIKRYNGLINYNSGLTEHYEVSRQLRQKALIRALGVSSTNEIFLVSKAGKDTEIQEVLNNGIIIVYSHKTHKKITLFAPSPERLEFLYGSVGLKVDDELLTISEENIRRGHNKILSI